MGHEEAPVLEHLRVTRLFNGDAVVDVSIVWVSGNVDKACVNKQ